MAAGSRWSNQRSNANVIFTVALNHRQISLFKNADSYFRTKTCVHESNELPSAAKPQPRVENMATKNTRIHKNFFVLLVFFVAILRWVARRRSAENLRALRSFLLLVARMGLIVNQQPRHPAAAGRFTRLRILELNTKPPTEERYSPTKADYQHTT